MPSSPGQASRPPDSECSGCFHVAPLLLGGGAAPRGVGLGGAAALVVSAAHSRFLLSFPRNLLSFPRNLLRFPRSLLSVQGSCLVNGLEDDLKNVYFIKMKGDVCSSNCPRIETSPTAAVTVGTQAGERSVLSAWRLPISKPLVGPAWPREWSRERGPRTE